jgi:hypothetical protein
VKLQWQNKNGTIRKPSKYGNVKTEYQGILFDSKGEARRYQDLLTLQSAGVISELSIQPVFKICVNGKAICKYIGDFQYYESGKKIIEDWKGKRTAVFNLKAKLFAALYPDLELRITGTRANERPRRRKGNT